jgi:hypothetical protein
MRGENTGKFFNGQRGVGFQTSENEPHFLQELETRTKAIDKKKDPQIKNGSSGTVGLGL